MVKVKDYLVFIYKSLKFISLSQSVNREFDIFIFLKHLSVTQLSCQFYLRLNSWGSFWDNFLASAVIVTVIGTWNVTQAWHAPLLCSLCWSWHGPRRWQTYHVQVQIQSPIIINKKYKKQRTFRIHGFWWENNLKISDDKKERKRFYRPFEKPQWDSRTLKPSTEYRLCN